MTIGNIDIGLLDIAALLIVLVGAVSGSITGFAHKAGRTAGFILAMPIALLFTKTAGAFIAEQTSLSIFVSTMIAFISISALAYLLICIFTGQIATIIESSTVMRTIDSILGFALGLICSALVLSAIIALLKAQPVIDVSALTENSIILERIINPLFPQMKDIFIGVIDGI